MLYLNMNNILFHKDIIDKYSYHILTTVTTIIFNYRLLIFFLAGTIGRPTCTCKNWELQITIYWKLKPLLGLSTIRLVDAWRNWHYKCVVLNMIMNDKTCTYWNNLFIIFVFMHVILLVVVRKYRFQRS